MVNLSIVIPVYNGEFYIKACVNALLPHLKYGIELVIVNDGSTDSTSSALRNYEGIPNCKIITIPNSGALAARVAGAEIATGDYIYFMDVDDSLSDDFFIDIPGEIKINHPDVILFGGRRVFPDNRKPIDLPNIVSAGVYKKKEIQEKIIPNLFCTQNLYGKRNILPNLWAKVFRKSLLLSCLKPFLGKRIIIGEDLALSVCVMLQAEIVSVLPHKAYYNYLTNSHSVMNTYKNNLYTDTLWICSYLETLSNSQIYLKGIERERVFFAISTYYNEFFYKNFRRQKEKKYVIYALCRDDDLHRSIARLEMKKVGLPNRVIIKLIFKQKVKSLMVIGACIETIRPILTRVILT